MSDHTTIEWTDATWNPITGCTLVSEGCRHCYAAQLAATRLRNHPSRAGLARLNAAGEAKFTGEVRLNADWLDQPLRWRRPHRIFVCAHGDLFHEAVPDEWIDRVFAVMALAPQHVFQILTKRPERMKDYTGRILDRSVEIAKAAKPIRFGTRFDNAYVAAHRRLTISPLPNVWLGTSVEDQATADARIPHLLAAPAAVRFLSAEPLLGPVDLTSIDPTGHTRAIGASGWSAIWKGNILGRAWLDWVIVGGESGRHARPMHPDWARSLRDQCQAAGVAFFFKQWGEWAPDAGHLADGSDPIIDGRVRCAVRTGSDWTFFSDGYAPPVLPAPEPEWVYRLGKRRAGRLLDGRAWDQTPASVERPAPPAEVMADPGDGDRPPDRGHDGDPRQPQTALDHPAPLNTQNAGCQTEPWPATTPDGLD